MKRLTHLLFLIPSLASECLASKDAFQCYCIQYDYEYVFFDKNMTLREIMTKLFLYDMHYLSKGRLSKIESMDLRKKTWDATLGSNLQGKALAFNVQDLAILSKLCPSSVTQDVHLTDQKKLSQQLFGYASLWPAHQGTLRVDVYMHGHAASCLNLEQLTKHLKEAAREQAQAEEEDLPKQYGAAKRMYIWGGGSTVVILVALGAQRASKKHVQPPHPKQRNKVV